MNKKAGRPYESLTQVIFQAIHGQKEFPNLVVEHDVTLQGRTLSHQIDVHWKFEVGGVPHEVIVQTKDWVKPVDQLHLLAFKAILDDLPGQPRGIFVTRSGYQSGAKEFALANGILLYELKEAEYPPALPVTAGGWATFKLVAMPLQGLITNGEPEIDAGGVVGIGFEQEVFTPYISEINFTVSKSWLTTEYPNEDIESLRRVTPPVALLRDRVFFDDKGAVVGNLASVLDEIVQSMKKDGVETREANHVFKPAVFIQTGSSRIPRIEITAVSMKVEIRRTRGLVRTRTSNFIELVLHQLNSDHKWWFAATPKVISSLSKRRSKKQ
jgi:hypothetical protein